VKAESHILVCGANWLGDACMTMPALQQFHAQHRGVRITMLTRPALGPLWNMHPAIDGTLGLTPDLGGMRKAIRAVKALHADTAYVFPNSWRSALIPFLARIPRRVGMPGHHRGILLTETARPTAPSADRHQQWEYADILQLQDLTALPTPLLNVPDSATQALLSRLPPSPDAAADWIGILPGAARGPSKQWPQAHFVAAAKLISEAHPCRFLLLGTPGEAGLCQAVATAIGPSAVSLAGSTSIPELMAALARCRTVLCNDSGGMHLAASAGTPVVAIFGVTDPLKTGPLGAGHARVCATGLFASRDVPRDSSAARNALSGIPPDRVARAAIHILNSRTAP